MDAEALRAWLDAYGRAWETRDPDAAVELFSEDATYRETPFGVVMEGRDAIRSYWQEIPETQRDISFGADILGLDPALVHWWSSYTRIRDDAPVRLDGVFLLEFDDASRCTKLREWWHADPGPAL